MAARISTGMGRRYTSCGNFRECDALVSGSTERVPSQFISHDDLVAGRWRAALEAVLAPLEPPDEYAEAVGVIVMGGRAQ